MTKSEYASYLQSPQWKELRSCHLKSEPNCQRCQLPRWLAELIYDQDLHVHHVSYAHLAIPEEADDLETLCRRCHEVETFGRSELRAPKEATCTVCGARHWDYRSEFCEICIEIIFNREKLHASLFSINPADNEPMWKAVMCRLRVNAKWQRLIDPQELLKLATVKPLDQSAFKDIF